MMKRAYKVVALLIMCVLHVTTQGCTDPARSPEEAAPAPSAPPPAPTSPACSTAYPVANGAPLAEGAPIPDLSFAGFDEAGAARTLAMRDWFEPCAAKPRVLVVRVNGGTWCGTCRWHAAHTMEAMAVAPARVRWLDLVVGDQDNAPARTTDLPAWRALLDEPARAHVAVAVDPTFSLRALGPEPGVLLPFYVLVDTRTMVVRATMSNPDPEALATRLEATIAALDGGAAPAARKEAPYDGLFRRNEWDMIREMRGENALSVPPADPTNAAADSASAAVLGKALFFDVDVSPSGNVACATCHDPTKQLSDGRATGLGLALGDRRTPRIALAAFSRWQFWDGRADSLWSQALGPIENPGEIGATRIGLVRRIASRWQSELAAAFPGLALPDLARLPEQGKPGDATWEALSKADQDSVTRVFVAAGKAIAAYERTFRVQPNRLDAYARGEVGALSNDEKQGLSLFARLGCMQCHWGPRLTDDAFHVTRLRSGRTDGKPDRGRIDGLPLLRASDFASTGRWSDAPAKGIAITDGPAPSSALGAFKTPSLRGVAGGGPYGHGGTETLVTITEAYGLGGLVPSDPRTIGALEPWLARFDVTAQWAIPIFMEALSAEPLVP